MLGELAILQKLLWLSLSIPATDLILSSRKNKKLASAEMGKESDIKNLLGTDGLQISKNYTLSEKSTQMHVIIIAPTRAGKSTSVFIPNLLQNYLKGSIIVADCKGELYHYTHQYQRSIGRKTLLFKPLEYGLEYNLLKQCKNDRDIMNLSKNLLINGSLSMELETGKRSGGLDWLMMATPLLTACLMVSNTIQNALKLILTNDSEQLDEIFENAKKNAKMQYLSFKTGCEAKGMIGSIKGTLSSNLSLFLDELAIRKTDFTAEQLRKEPTTLYVSYPANKSNYLSPLMSCLYSQLIEILTDTKGLPITLLFDEMANQGMFSNMRTNISTVASSGIAYVLCLQDLNQLKQIYGENYLTIWGNCNTKIILPGLTDTLTLSKITEICGEEEILIQQDNRKVKTKKRLLNADEIRRLADDECLIICKNRKPIIDKQNIYYNQKKYTDQLKSIPRF